MAEETEINAKELPASEEEPQSKVRLVIGIIIAVLLLAGLIVGLISLAREPETAAAVRDIFIILLAFEIFLIGIAAVILIVQIATLTNLLQNEIKPILNSTTDTVNTLKGTVRFLSDNLTEPVIKMNESLASVRKLVDLFRFK
jgi:hypothetical protein